VKFHDFGTKDVDSRYFEITCYHWCSFYSFLQHLFSDLSFTKSCRRKETIMIEILVELLILAVILGIIFVVALVLKWFVHFAE
jgi:hypothetical protein